MITVADEVDWEAGDWIFVATTDFSPVSSEIVQIQSIASDQKTITLSQRLVNYHFGGAAPTGGFWEDSTTNYGIDERAEVALLTRSIKFTAEAGNGHRGGDIHIMAPGTNGEVYIEGVEFEKFGKDSLGNYPIHFHLAGEVADKATISSNSIHHSYNKCVTIHQTNHTHIEQNVCARIVGNAFFMEDGPENGNEFDGNFVGGVMLTRFKPTKNQASYWAGDHLASEIGYNGDSVMLISGVSNEYIAPAGFWVRNPLNSFTNNSVAGVQGKGRGFWLLPTDDNNRDTLTLFQNNRFHACYNGVDNASDDHSPGVNHLPRKDVSHDRITYFDGVTVTRNRNIGVWLRPSWNHVKNFRAACNRQSISLVSSGGVEGIQPGMWGFADRKRDGRNEHE